MKKLSNIVKYSATIGVAIGAYLSKCFLASPSAENLQTPFLILVMVTMTVVLARACELVVGEVLDRSYWLRRLVEWRTSIEGFWFDYSKANGGEYGLIEISYEGGEYIIKGKTFSESGDFIYSWISDFSDFKGDQLKYLYRSVDENDQTPYQEIYGYLNKVFVRDSPRGAPNRYSATLLDISNTPKKAIFEGIRISSRDHKKAQCSAGHLKSLRGKMQS